MKKKFIILSIGILAVIFGYLKYDTEKKNKKDIKIVSIEKREKEELNDKFKNIIFAISNGKSIIFSNEKMTYEYDTEKKELTKIDKYIVGKVGDYYVAMNEKLGIVDKNYKEIISPIFTAVTESNIKNIAIVKKENKSYLLSIAENKVLREYDEIIQEPNNKNIHIIKDGMHGYLNEKLEEVIPPKYTYVFSIKYDNAIVYHNDNYGVVNTKDETVVPFEYKEIYLHTNGNIIIKENNMHSMDYISIDNIKREENQKEDDGRYIDFATKKEIPVDRIFPTLEDYGVYEKNNRFGIIDFGTYKLSNKTYGEISPRVEGEYIIVGEKEKYNVTRVKDFDKEINLKYDYISPIGKDIFVGGSYEKGLNALIIPDEKEIKETEEIYERVVALGNYFFGQKEDDSCDLINKKGEVVASFEQKEMVYENNQMVILDKKDKIEIIIIK